MGEAEVDPDHADRTDHPDHADHATPDRDERPPLGSWARTYTVTLVLAVACIALLYWFTQAFNIPQDPNR